MDQLLREIASNFWFEWNPEARLLFSDFNPQLWTLCNRNPHRFLAYRAENPLEYEKRFAELLTDPDYVARYERVQKSFQNYFNPATSTWIKQTHPELENKTVAYLSMEYGIETLKIYSGGLGILSGDHIRGASDIGLNFVAVGLFYLQGYYEQEVTREGEMRVTYDSIVPARDTIREHLALESVKRNGGGQDLVVRVQIGNREVAVKVWRAKIGRCDLLLLDTNIKENQIHDRHITRRLYASEKQHYEERLRRFEQEMVLGIGGVKVLREAGYQPAFYHLNEGHVALSILEAIRIQMEQDKIGYKEALNRASAKIGFTSHTPVPEGNERFDEGMVRPMLIPYLDSFAPKEEQEILFNCARNQQDQFDMTKFSLLLAGAFKNGVSQLHGEVCRKMWRYAWGDHYKTDDQVPIGSITNGVHIPYWVAPEIERLVIQAGGYQNANQIPDEQLWKAKAYRKMRLIVKVRERAAYHMLRIGNKPEEVSKQVQQWLDPEAFMIGFARRFAGYKRVTWILEDEKLLFSFLESSYKKYGKPVQILFAGKPHPDNHSAHEQIRFIYHMSTRLNECAQARNFKAQIFFVEAYDVDLARRLVSGVDVWLNNPIRPLEASGTSGMKAGMNGTLNLSISDGWCAEGIKTGENGWLFGQGTEASSSEDRRELFRLLENTILPIYFERPNPSLDHSPKWLALMKNAIQTVTQQFDIERMLREYVEKMYLPAIKNMPAHQTLRV